MYLVKTHIKPSAIEGNGLFAGEFIPKGTIVFLYGNTERFYSREEIRSMPEFEREQLSRRLFKYGVEDEFGNWNMTLTGPVSGDINHSCDANILSLFIDGLYCDIAIRDIHEKEEITVDYGMFYSSYPWSMDCRCNSPICRQIAGSGIHVDHKTEDLWYSRISEAAKHIFEVKQPLFSLDDDKARKLAQAIKAKRFPFIVPYIKFSLISKGNDCIQSL